MPREWQRMLVADDLSVAERHEDGRITTGVKVIMSDEDIEATRQGYKCIGCYENLDNAFPEQCPVCGFPMKENQSETFERVYVGFVPGARTGADFEREADRIQAEAERREYESRTGISVVVGKNLKKEHRS